MYNFKKFLISIYILFISNLTIIQAQSINSVSGIYNNWEMNFQLRLESDGTLEFYTATSYTPYYGSWKKSGNNILISIPDYVTKSLKFKIKHDGFYNDSGKLVWKKAID